MKLYFIKNIFLVSFTTVSLLLSFECSKEEIIEEDKFVLIYSDMVIAQDTLSLSSKGVNSLRKAVFSKYNVTEELYKATLDYYNRDAKRWEEFFNKVIDHVKSLSQTPSLSEGTK